VWDFEPIEDYGDLTASTDEEEEEDDAPPTAVK
jgi:hypothetical protein